MEISVVVPVHNAARFIEQTLCSVAEQDYPASQIIVVDDGSVDNSASIVRDWVARFTTIQLISVDIAVGPSAARNLGWQAAQSPWIAFVDADDIWHSAHLRYLADAVRRVPKASVVFSDIEAFSETPTFGRELDDASAEPPQPMTIDEPAFGLFSREMAISQSGVMVRRDSLERVGGYDESRRYAEDLELWFRLAHANSFARVPVATVAYRVHQNQTSVRNAARMYAAGWEIRRAARDSFNECGGTEIRRWNKAEHELLARDLSEAWHSGQRNALDTMLDIVQRSRVAGALASWWTVRRAMLWHPYVLLRRVARALRSRRQAR